MAQLVYMAQSGETTAIELPKKPGFTARVLWLQLPAATQAIRDQIQVDLGISDGSKQAQVGDHAVYAQDNHYVVVIIQPGSTRDRKGSADRPMVIQQGMLIHRSRREWIVIAEDGTQLSSAGQPIPMMRIVQDGTDLRLGNLVVTFSEIERKLLDERQVVLLERRHCPYCGDPFVRDEMIIACPSCGTVQHAECWEEYGKRCSGPPGCRYGLPTNRSARTAP